MGFSFSAYEIAHRGRTPGAAEGGSVRGARGNGANARRWRGGEFVWRECESAARQGTGKVVPADSVLSVAAPDPQSVVQPLIPGHRHKGGYVASNV